MTPNFILAVERQRLPAWLKDAEGYYAQQLTEFEEQVDDLMYMHRPAIETDSTPYVHFISYTLLTYKHQQESRKYFCYQRRQGVGESQLVGNTSIGVGGHVQIEDGSFSDILQATAHTELAEEVRVKGVGPLWSSYFTLQPLGTLYDGSNAVGRRHVGVVTQLDLSSHSSNLPTVEMCEPELKTIGWLTKDELLQDERLENWSRMVLDAQRD